MSWKMESNLDVSKLTSLIKNLGNVEDDILMPVADEIVEEIKENIVQQGVIDTGALLDSITAEKRGDEIWIRDGVEHGIYNEFGTYKMAARPFFIPALESFGTLIYQKFIEIMK